MVNLFYTPGKYIRVSGVLDQQGTEKSGCAKGAEAAATATARGGRRGGWRRCRQSGGKRLR